MSAAGLLSWGRHPHFPQVPTPCHWRNEMPDRLALARQAQGTTLPYGAGLSYGDSCLAASDHVLHMRPLDRFISADWSSGVLQAEAGVTFEEILAVAGGKKTKSEINGVGEEEFATWSIGPTL